MKPSHKLSHEGSRPCIAMLVWNDCRSDYRVLREAESLRNAGYRVCLFGIVKGRIGVETVRIRNLRVRLVGTGNPYHAGSKAWHLYISTIWCLSRLINLQKPDYLHAHDWSGLIPLYFYKWRYAARIPLIWDNHEIGCSDYRQLWHRFPWPWNALNMVMEWLGRRIVRRSVQSVIVVNDHLAEL
nr:glycosyltransferase [Candidatus Delongbacteria bacterium]